MKKPDLLPLEKVLPEGQLASRAWLAKQGFHAPRIDAALRSQKLEAVAHGVYRRPGPPLKWEQVVYSLTQMGHNLHVGGYSALQHAGMAHYVAFARSEDVDLYGPTKAPTWLFQYKGGEVIDKNRTVGWNRYFFHVHTRPRFTELSSNAITQKLFGTWDWFIPHSTPELAFLELLESVENSADFDLADKHFELAGRLRPELLNDILAACQSVKVKRLFFWFGKRHAHPWFSELDRERANLGSGKRMLVRGGALDKDYEITVPKEMAHGSDQSLF